MRARIRAYFAELDDPRTGPAILHRLIDIVVIALCAVICGADEWVEVEQFGQAKYAWSKRFLELPHGIPSHDTFGPAFSVDALDQLLDCGFQAQRAVAHEARG